MILLDYKDRRPIYEQVVEKLQELMLCGVLEQDIQLPTVRRLACELSINPNTIQRAYGELERRGFIYSVKGKGSFVSDTASIRALKVSELRSDMKGLLTEVRHSGVSEREVHSWVAEDWQQHEVREEKEDD